MNPKVYMVYGPEYGVVIPLLDFGMGPTEWGRDVVHVFTTTKKRAKVLALRVFRKQYWRRRAWWVHDVHEDWWNWGENPFRLMTVEEMPKEWVGEAND